MFLTKKILPSKHGHTIFYTERSRTLPTIWTCRNLISNGSHFWNMIRASLNEYRKKKNWLETSDAYLHIGRLRGATSSIYSSAVSGRTRGAMCSTSFYCCRHCWFSASRSHLYPHATASSQAQPLPSPLAAFALIPQPGDRMSRHD